MYNILENVLNEYSKEIEKILQENTLEIENSRTSSCIEFNMKEYSTTIPFIKPLTRTKFYTNIPYNIETPDKTILEYLPSIVSTKKRIPVLYYEDTVLFHTPYNNSSEILLRCINKIYECEKYNLQSLTELFNISSLDLENFCKKQLKAVKIQNLNNKDLRYDFNKNLCSVCFLFKCKEHKIRKSIKINIISENCICEKLGVQVKRENEQSTATNNSRNRKIDKKRELQKIQADYNKRKKLLAPLYQKYNGETCLVSYHHQLINKKYISCREIEKMLKETPAVTKLQQNTRMDKEGCKCVKGCIRKCQCRLNDEECGWYCKCANCQNNEIQTKKGKKTFVSTSKVSGTGCFAAEKIKKGEFVIEYVGEIISGKEANRRGNFYDINMSSYLFCLSDKNNRRVIDAYYYGNNSRFVNHSDNPNLVSKIVCVNNDPHISFYAKRNIKIFEELFVDYKYEKELKKMYKLK